MEKSNIRLFLLLIVFATGLFLYNLWEQEMQPQAVKNASAVLNSSSDNQKAKNESVTSDVPTITTAKAAVEAENMVSKAEDLITVITDVMQLKINLRGGDIEQLELLQYKDSQTKDAKAYAFLDKSKQKFYIAQSFLLNEDFPDSAKHGRVIYNTKEKNYALPANMDSMNIDLLFNNAGINLIKRFTFERGKYPIKISYIIANSSDKPYTANLFGRLKQKYIKPDGGFFSGLRTYTGGAINSTEKAYKKLPFEDFASKPVTQKTKGGWIAMVEHYFTAAWIPDIEKEHSYSTVKLEDNMYGVAFLDEAVTVAPGETKEVSAKLFAGPEVTDLLKQAAPALELTVDYGVLWPLCAPIFWLLKFLHTYLGNWGVAIILTTLIIKLIFYHLSATSYRSMGNMKKIQPRIEALKQQYGDDKQGFSQAVMALYRQEKVNPLGGCLPLLVQVPVFIALYYVLLESIELRHASFIWWITDLAAKDPYYVLPIIMGATMFWQQKLSPPSPDPVQAKVMLAMPIVFTALFMNFQSGLILYMLVNNILSITQQWYITRKYAT